MRRQVGTVMRGRATGAGRRGGDRDDGGKGRSQHRQSGRETAAARAKEARDPPLFRGACAQGNHTAVAAAAGGAHRQGGLAPPTTQARTANAKPAGRVRAGTVVAARPRGDEAARDAPADARHATTGSNKNT